MPTARTLLETFLEGTHPDPVIACPLFSETLPRKWIDAAWDAPAHDPAMIEAKLMVGERCGFAPILKFELGGLGFLDATATVLEDHGHEKLIRYDTPTPDGPMTGVLRRTAHGAIAEQKMVHTIEDTMRLVAAWEQCGDYDTLARNLRSLVERVGERGMICLNLGHAFGSLEDHVTTVFFALEEPDRMIEAAHRRCTVLERILDTAVETGVRLFFGGSLGANIYSPDMVEQFMLPCSIRLREAAHRRGAFYYQHECGDMKLKLGRGFYQRIAPDWLEGFEAPPVGDVDDLPVVRQRVDRNIVFKGNLNLEFVERATPKAVEAATLAMLEGLRGYRHVVGGACSLLPDTPQANVRAMVTATARFLGRHPDDLAPQSPDHAHANA